MLTYPSLLLKSKLDYLTGLKKGNARDTKLVGLLPRIDSFLATLFIANYQTILLRSTNI